MSWARTPRLSHLVRGLLFVLLATPAAGQVANPNADFVQAFARFSLALDGGYGDEGVRILSSLESMERALEQWEARIRAYEAAMTSELGRADPQLAARMHTAIGGIYLDRGRVADALREFAAASQLDPNRPDIYALQGLAYSQLANEPRAAAEAFKKASALDPQNPVRAYMLARQLVKVGELEEARKARRFVFDGGQKLVSPVQGQSSAISSFIRLGLVQEKSGVEPFFPPALYAEGFALVQRGDYPGAIAQFRNASARDPLIADPIAQADAMRQAAAAFRDGLVQVAVQRLKAAVELSPDRAETHRIFGRVHLANEHYDEGIEELRTAVRLDPGNERARLNLADAFVETEQFAAAEQALQQSLKVFPASGRTRFALGRLYQRQGLPAEALRELGEAIKLNPLLGLNGIYQDMGAINADRQDFDAAVVAYEKRVDVHPNDADAHHDLGKTYSRLNRDEEALTEFAVTLMLDPRHVESYVAMAQVHLREGRLAEAAETAQRALRLDKTHQQARYTFATALMRLDRREEGTRELDEFQRLQAEEAAVHARATALGGLRREASVSSASGDHEKAVALLRQALALEPDSMVSHLNLGLALARAGQPAEAIERFKSAVALNGPAVLHRQLAEAYAAIGQAEESRKELTIYEQMKQESLRRAGASR